MGNLTAKKAWIFDCDGVLINSNEIKAQSMFEAAREFDEGAAHKLLTFHKNNGGVGREIKFRKFFEEYLGISKNYQAQYSKLMSSYSKKTLRALQSCEVAPSAISLLQLLKKNGVYLFVCSGAEQQELKQILIQKGLSHYFESILGSPQNKLQHVTTIKTQGHDPKVFIGDSLYDHHVAKTFNLKFYFMSAWTDFSGWQEHFADQSNVTTYPSLDYILKEVSQGQL